MSMKWRLILLSFLMLFVELALIRWLGANIIYLSYFSNFVLLGSFLGIGVGFLRSKSRMDLFPWAAIALAFLIALVMVFPVQVHSSSAQVIYFGDEHASGLPIFVTLPVIFVLVALVMASIAQGVSRTFSAFEPLEAYRLDILGSLAGIATFTLLSFLGTPPAVWGAIVAIVFFALYGRTVRVVQVVAVAGMLAVLVHESLNPSDRWSPYYRVSVFDSVPASIKEITVNGIPHQMIESLAQRRRLEPLYFAPYRRLHGNPMRDVLIVGAGNGSDAAIALAAGAKHIDAVEIDRQIYNIGRQMNPERPYQNPRVSVHIDDGRAFLQQSRKRYDLILFALPDSLVLVSGQSSLRLESYLFTSEAMQSARRHLKAGGAFGMYNYYREQWLVDRLAATLQRTYGRAPCIDSVGRSRHFALLMDSSAPGALNCPTTWVASSSAVPAPADDDHPFLYLQKRSIPNLYLITIAGILVLSLVLIRTSAGSFRQMRGYGDLFFMGAAFLLLETKNVVQFALLFGTTWLVNALVFFGILLAIYAAIEVARRVDVRKPAQLYAALFVSLGLAWVVPPESLLALALPLRFLASISLAFAPIFVANLVFAARFREVGSSTIAFGTNLLGAMVGGVLEYSSLIIGYRSLLVVIALLYGLAFLLAQKRAVADTGEAATKETVEPAFASV